MGDSDGPPMEGIAGFARWPHYATHVRSVLDAIDPTLPLYAARTGSPWGPQPPPGWEPDVVIVAGFADLQAIQRWRPAKIVHLEHGAGQTYEGITSPSYAGGKHRLLGTVDLFLTAGEHGAARWRDTYPDIPAVPVGAPKLDRHHRAPHGDGIVFTRHWDCRLVPETRSAVDHYRRALPDVIARLKADGHRVYGHTHPRCPQGMRRWWEQWGAEVLADETEVFAHGGMLVADNTSMIYEFAALDRPTVCLNAPWYRRDVHHGMRFWDLIPGPQVNEPDGLHDAISAAFLPQWGDTRRDVSTVVYGAPVGSAGEIAAEAIRVALGGDGAGCENEQR